MAKRTTSHATSLDFAFFQHLHAFYRDNRGRIRQNYRELTRKFLDFNDPENVHAFLRKPQFEALEMYIFLKEFLDNQPVHAIFKEWSEQQGHFAGRRAAAQANQQTLFDLRTKDDYALVYTQMRTNARYN